MRRSVVLDPDSIAQYALIALCGLLPFFFIPIEGATIFQAKTILVTLCLVVSSVAWAIARYREREARIYVSIIGAAALALPLAYVLSAAMNRFAPVSVVGNGASQDTLISAVLISGALLLSMQIFSRDERTLLLALRAFFAGGAAMLLLEWLHILFPAAPLSSVLAAPSANPLGTWHEASIAVGAFLFLSLFLRDTAIAEGPWRYVFWGNIVLTPPLLILMNSTDVWMALAAIFFSACAYEWKKREPRPKTVSRRPLLFLVLASGSVAFALWGGLLFSVLPNRLQISNLEVRPSWQGTYKLALETLGSPKTALLGTGPNTFARDWTRYKPSSVNQTQFWNTRFESGVGTVPTALITGGIIVFLAWLGLIVAIGWSFYRSLVRGRHGPAEPALFALGLGSVYFLTFHVFYVPQISLTTLSFVFIGMFAALEGSARRLPGMSLRFSHRIEWPVYVAIGCIAAYMLALVVSALFALRVVSAEIYVNRSILAYNERQDIQEATTLLQRALFLYGSNDRAHRAGVEIGILEMRALSASGGTDTSTRLALQSILQQTIEHGLAAVSIDGSEYQNWLELAVLYQSLGGASVEGAYGSARAAYEQARQVSPSNPLIYLRLAQLDVLEGKPQAALSDLQTALTLKPDLAAAYYLKSQVHASLGQMQQSYDAALQATQYAPDDPLSWYNAGVVSYARGEWENAIASERRALSLNPQYANALYVLGLSYYGAGRTADALGAFVLLRGIDTQEEGINLIISNLEAGRPPLSGATATPTPRVGLP